MALLEEEYHHQGGLRGLISSSLTTMTKFFLLLHADQDSGSHLYHMSACVPPYPVMMIID